MPTGYTAGIADGKIRTFREFALQCARGMGALVSMRDEPLDAPIPETIEPRSYHTEQLAKAHDRLAKLKLMSIDEAQFEAAQEHKKEEERYVVRKMENAEQQARYDRFIAETRVWEGAPAGLKEFMLSQLTESKRFDCYEPDAPETPMTGQEWLAVKTSKAERDIDYHQKEEAKDIARAKECTEWLQQLRASLPDE